MAMWHVVIRLVDIFACFTGKYWQLLLTLYCLLTFLGVVVLLCGCTQGSVDWLTGWLTGW